MRLRPAVLSNSAIVLQTAGRVFYGILCTLMWKTSRWPCCVALRRCAKRSTRNFRRTSMVWRGFSSIEHGVTDHRSGLPQRMIASTVALTLFSMVATWQ